MHARDVQACHFCTTAVINDSSAYTQRRCYFQKFLSDPNRDQLGSVSAEINIACYPGLLTSIKVDYFD